MNAEAVERSRLGEARVTVTACRYDLPAIPKKPRTVHLVK